MVEVEIYNDPECTPESHVHTVPLKNVPNSINMDVAKFEKGDEIYLDEIRIMEIGPVSAARKPAAKKNAAPAAKKF